MSEDTETIQGEGGGKGKRIAKAIGVVLLSIAVFLMVVGVPLLLHPERWGNVEEAIGRVTKAVSGNTSGGLVTVYDNRLPPVLPRNVPPPPPKPLRSIVVREGLTSSEWWNKVGLKGSKAIDRTIFQMIWWYEAGTLGKDCYKYALTSMVCLGNPFNKYALIRTSSVESLFWTRDLYVKYVPDKPYIYVALEEVSGDKINVTAIFYEANKDNALRIAWWIRNISLKRPVILSLGRYDPRFIKLGWGYVDLQGTIANEDAVRWLREHKAMNPIIVEVAVPSVVWAHGDPDAVSKTRYWFNEVEKPFIDTVAREIVLRTRYWSNIYPVEATGVTILLYKGCAIGHLSWYVGVPPYAEYLGDWGFADIILPRLDWDEQYERVCVNRTIYVDWYGEIPHLLVNASIYPNLDEAFATGRLKALDWARNLLGEIEDYETWSRRWIRGGREPSLVWLVEKYIEYRRQLYPDVPVLELEASIKIVENLLKRIEMAEKNQTQANTTR